jgi:hypothetical protein
MGENGKMFHMPENATFCPAGQKLPPLLVAKYGKNTIFITLPICLVILASSNMTRGIFWSVFLAERAMMEMLLLDAKSYRAGDISDDGNC